MSLPVAAQQLPGPANHASSTVPLCQDAPHDASLMQQMNSAQAQPAVPSSQPHLVPGVEPLVALIMADKNFSTAVHAQQLHLAAAAAVSVFKATTAALDRSRQALSGAEANHGFMLADQAEHRRGGDARELKVSDRVLVHGSNKRGPQEIVGREAVVISLHGNGWLLVQLLDTGEHMRIQQRYLSHAPPSTDALQQHTLRGSQPVPALRNHAAAMLDLDNFPDLPDNLDGMVDGELSPGDLLLPDTSPRSGHDLGLHLQMPTAQMLQQSSLHGSAAAQPGSNGYTGMAMGGMRQPAAVPGRAAMQGGAGTMPHPFAKQDLLHNVRYEMTQLEEAVPWNAVRKNWRAKRANWRRALSRAETVVEVAKCLRDFRSSLATDNTSVSLPLTWDHSIASCIQGIGSLSVLVALWNELKADVSEWLDVPIQPSTLPSASPQADAAALRAIQAMQGVAGQCGALLQVPVESILNNNQDSRVAASRMLEHHRQLMAAKMAAFRRGEPLPQHSLLLPAGYQNGATATWPSMDGFDSGAETETEQGSEVTEMSDCDT